MRPLWVRTVSVADAALGPSGSVRVRVHHLAELLSAIQATCGVRVNRGLLGHIEDGGPGTARAIGTCLHEVRQETVR